AQNVSVDEIIAEINEDVQAMETIDATDLAIKYFDNEKITNILLLSKASELGWLPFSSKVLKTALHQVFQNELLAINLKALKYFSSSETDDLLEFSSIYRLMSGNEAAAYGAMQEGVEFVYSYPGSPVTQIAEILIDRAKSQHDSSSSDSNDFTGLNACWSINETVALQKAAACALSGAKTMAIMKQNGLNIVADFLLTFAHTGLEKGSLVLILGDDPGALASTSSIDSRWILRTANIPVLSPSTPAEIEMMVRWAFNLSELLKQIVVIRITTRVAHQQSLVQVEHDVDDLHFSEHSEKIDDESEQVIKWDAENVRAVNLPVLSQKRSQVGKMKVAQNISEKNMFNRVFGLNKSEKFDLIEQVRNEFADDETVLIDGEPNCRKNKREKPELVIIASEIGFSIAYEAVDTLRLWNKIRLVKLGFAFPLPIHFLHDNIADVEKILIVEDTSAFIETEIRSLFVDLNKKWYGRINGRIDEVDELNPDTLKKTLINIIHADSLEHVEEISPGVDTDVSHNKRTLPELPHRELSLCSGCPHKASFWVMKTVLEDYGQKYVIAGDVGCYTLGCLDAGFNMLQTVNCMGSSIGMGAGFSEIGRFTDTLALAVIGDSTFLHSGLPGIIDSKINDSNVLVVILDNDYIAMTGGQKSASKFMKIDIMLDALDIKYEIVDPFNFQDAILGFFDALDETGTRCVIFRAPCTLQKEKHDELNDNKYVVDQELCEYGNEDCLVVCINTFSCPAIEIDAVLRKPVINDEMCKRCGFCTIVCKKNAIKREGGQTH
ncbi:MAG: hypothetical protein K8S87_12005, partial [Planctomycetes bacterium]|nr:hypothetical protein [Planctomycetota bacterium]